ncbi:hypothetical protein [Nocardioides sp.]|uniref:hypothetical protein n=1 Tax=Nocardioides sp. TaxID=35761 RepID=UPI003D0BC9AF
MDSTSFSRVRTPQVTRKRILRFCSFLRLQHPGWTWELSMRAVTAVDWAAAQDGVAPGPGARGTVEPHLVDAFSLRFADLEARTVVATPLPPGGIWTRGAVRYSIDLSTGRVHDDRAALPELGQPQPG